MPPLDLESRRVLERSIVEARNVAEIGVREAFEVLGIAEKRPFQYLRPEQRELRKKLRIHAQQLGDSLLGDHGIDLLVEEAAYQHWHRMLFTKFLAENKLLMYPDPSGSIPITIEECEELAKENDAQNAWELASRYASIMLPQIFRQESPLLAFNLPTNRQQELEKILNSLPPVLFSASDGLGWVYQYWQTQRKNEINKSISKIGSKEISAVTQLFTESYMVDFLLDNSLGAWWAGKYLSSDDLLCASCEEDLRKKIALPDYSFEFLRFIRSDDGKWTPAAGVFKDWPKQVTKLKILDPCCGSGHFLVSIFRILLQMYIVEEDIAITDAINAILRNNIYGLEIDNRCVELAVFAIALSAWTCKYCHGYRILPKLNIACCGQAVSSDEGTWLNIIPDNLRYIFRELRESFLNAPILGSLIRVNQESVLDDSELKAMQEIIKTLRSENINSDDLINLNENAVTAEGIEDAVHILSKHYNLVATNVPYLSRKKQCDFLFEYCRQNYQYSMHDLATVFLERALSLNSEDGVSCLVMPQNWLSLGSYKKLRISLLKNNTFNVIVRLGANGFQTQMWDFNVQLLIVSKKSPKVQPQWENQNVNCGPIISCIDVSEFNDIQQKCIALKTATINNVYQNEQCRNPDARILSGAVHECDFLNKYTTCMQGLSTGDDMRYILHFFEISVIDHSVWEFMQNTPTNDSMYDGMSEIIKWENQSGALFDVQNAHPKSGLTAVGKHGIAIHRMGRIFSYCYSLERFHQNVAVIVPNASDNLLAIWCFCLSSEYKNSVRKIDETLKITNATLTKVPFNIGYWSKIAESEYPSGLPLPFTNDPTQWIFHGHPCGRVIWDGVEKITSKGEMRVDSIVLQVAVARLLGYRWPAEVEKNMELALEQRELVMRCDNLSEYVDDDGIVCIPAVRGEAPAEERLLNLLVAAYGDAWSQNILTQLLGNADNSGRSLEYWLRNKFFTQHCKLFGNRPFIWHIWDGHPEGFSVLINYHKFDDRHMQKLIYTYLGDWIARQRQDIENNVQGADGRLSAALELQKSLILIQKGEAPYDIFVRWKSLKEQPIGWTPDLNDGVRLNIRPFMTVPSVGKPGAGIMRDKPNIKWDKDRGKDVESAPWYHKFNGDRINDYHLTLAEKIAARTVK
jgi:hypothetical protein